MKKLLCTLAVAGLGMAILPAWAQRDPTTSLQTDPSEKGVTPGSGGVSKPGIAGKPGSKSGPTVLPSGSTNDPTSQRPAGDESGVRGMPGSKSGPAVKPPSK
jgi:hypothetical protein